MAGGAPASINKRTAFAVVMTVSMTSSTKMHTGAKACLRSLVG